jgi:hypothetical protein
LTPTADRLAISTGLFFAILTIEACGLFALRLPGTLEFNLAFGDTGANLTVQYLINHGYRPGVDLEYPHGLLPLWLGRLWFGIFGLSPFAYVALVPIFDLLIVLGFVRLAANLRLNLAGILIILLTAAQTITTSFPNLSHGMERIFLLQALADQAGGNRRRALAIAAATFFVKPSMAYFLGLLLIVFILIEWLRNRGRQMRELVLAMYPAAIVTGAIGATLFTYFGMAPVIRSLIPTQDSAIYRALDYGFFGPESRAFLAPRGAPWTYYCASIAGPWIAYTIALVVVASFGGSLSLECAHRQY